MYYTAICSSVKLLYGTQHIQITLLSKIAKFNIVVYTCLSTRSVYIQNKDNETNKQQKTQRKLETFYLLIMSFNCQDPVMQNSKEIERLLFNPVLKLQLKQFFQEPKIYLKGSNSLKIEKHALLQRVKNCDTMLGSGHITWVPDLVRRLSCLLRLSVKYSLYWEFQLIC